MNTRLIKECIIRVGEYLRRQDTLDPDINAYGKYYLDPPSFSESAPSIKAFHGLDEFPWPESKCLIMSKCDYGIRWKLGPQPESSNIIMDGVCTDLRQTEDRRFVKTGSIQFGGGHISIARVTHPAVIDESLAEEIRLHRFSDYPEVTASLIAATLRTDGPRWDFFGDLNQIGVDETTLTRDEVISLRAFTLAHLWHLSPLVSPTGYKLLVRPEPFGPGWLRRGFSKRPFYAIVNHDRLFRIYEESRDTEGGDVPRFMPLHHRRRHPRHLWRKAGIRLQDLPRDPVQRQLLVLERSVPRVMVKDCWVGSRQFSLDGFDFEVQDDE